MSEQTRTSVAMAMPPTELSFEGAMADNWAFFKQKFEIFLKASKLDDKPEDEKGFILLNRVGDRALRIYNTFQFDPVTDNTKYTAIMDKFEEKFIPVKNVTYERHMFFSRKKKPEETYDEYITELRRLSDSCEFATLCDDLIRDQLIMGIEAVQIKDRLLREPMLTLKKAAEICRIAETTAKQIQKMDAGNTNQELNVIQNNSGKKRTQQVNNRYRRGADTKAWAPDTSNQTRNEKGGRNKQKMSTNNYNNYINNCTRCGFSHNVNKCPAFGKQCNKCKRLNHFSNKCVSKVNVLHENHDNNDDYTEELVIGTIENGSNDKRWFQNCILNDKVEVTFRLDTGADCNVIPLSIVNKLEIKSLEKPPGIVTTLTNEKIDIIGTCMLKIYPKTGNRCDAIDERFYVYRNNNSILGLQTCVKLNLLKRSRIRSIDAVSETVDKIVVQYQSVFKGIGCIPGEHHIELKEDAVPRVHPPRKVPYAIYSKLKSKLQELERMSIIETVNVPTEWVSSLVIVPKKNLDLRLCIDPKDLNNAIKRQHFYIPTFDDLIHKLKGAKYFSILDCSNGFWQIKLDEYSSKLCTFNTPFGRYKFLRLPYGITSASEIFQRIISQIYDNTKGVITYIDDLLIFGATQEEHDINLKNVLQIADNNNIKFNLAKCKFSVNEVTYMGHKITDKGVQADDNKISAIINMRSPTDKKEVERFLGTINYLNRFIQNQSELTEPLRRLIKKDTLFYWGTEQENAFIKLKNLLVRTPVLQFYSPDDPITISCDSSKNGCGAVLLQNNAPIAYASKSFTETQKAYATIEKEMLAIVFACKKFHQFIFGRMDLTIETDHKPLITIYKKPLTLAPSRLQRMLIMLQPYTFNLIYKKGPELHIADTLSRSFENSVDSQFEAYCNEIEYQLCLVKEINPVSDQRLQQIKNETMHDTTLIKLISLLQNQGDYTKQNIEQDLKIYIPFLNELSIRDGIIYKADRILIPKKLQREILNKLHCGHIGREKTKLRARSIIFWPGINNDIDNLINNCDTCLNLSPENGREPIIQHAVPKGPWQKVGIDFFEFRDKNYILAVDYYSKFIEVSQISSLKSQTVIMYLKNIFCRHGVPHVVFTDNGPPFNSDNFKEFSSVWNFSHQTSSPHYPQSNGQVESMVKIIKRLLKVSETDKSDFYTSYLELMNTPLDNKTPSPAQLLYNRRLRTTIPVNEKLLKPKLIPQKETRCNLERRQAKYIKAYNKGARSLIELNKGDKVKVKNFKTNSQVKWLDGIVLKKTSNPRSYEIKLTNSAVVVRNRRHLIKIHKDTEPSPHKNLNYYIQPNYEIPSNRNNKNNTGNVVSSDKFIVTQTRPKRIIKPPNKLNL